MFDFVFVENVVDVPFAQHNIETAHLIWYQVLKLCLMLYLVL